MCFLFYDVVFLFLLLLLLLVFENECRPNDADLQINKNLFKFRHINQCNRNEFYDLDFFTCLPCDENNADVIQSDDKFACQCAPTSVTIALYDTAQRSPICIKPCSANNKDTPSSDNCLLPTNNDNGITNMGCKFKYINLTIPPISHAQIDSFSNVRITLNNPSLNENCTQCNSKYNFHYQDFCILNGLLKPYLNYNANRQQNSITADFQDLKFIAFFCLSLHNATACNHLANLCIIMHYNFDKNSPCSAFILSQTSESLLRYAQLDEQVRMVRPFIFYKKGKQTRRLLNEPVKDGAYTLASAQKNHKSNFLSFFATVYTIDGTLRRWGNFRSSHVNLCQLFTQGYSTNTDIFAEFRFGRHSEEKTCQMSLENIIDLALIYGNKYFMSIYLNITKYEKSTQQTLLQSVPILIESLSPENQRQEIDEWQLVKRFQLIEMQHRNNFGSQLPSYEDEHKLQLYKRIRYVEKFEISYNILEDRRITIPLIRLRFRSIEISANSSLDRIYPFRLSIKFNSQVEDNDAVLFDEILFSTFLLVALVATVLRTYNFRNRRTLLESTEICDFTCLAEFLLFLISNVANAFLVFFLVHISYRSLAYLAQRSVAITLPIVKDHSSLDMLIYAVLILKCIYLSIYFWRLGHIELFFIDWERPKSCDSNHFNFKSNLDTSSVCSSVRTFVSENNVSAWRMFFIANEWITLSCKQKSSILIRAIFTLISYNLFDHSYNIQRDITLQLFVLIACYLAIYMLQLFFHHYVLNRIFGCPLQTFVDTCSLANISVFTLHESSYGFYIHGRSPHGFSDTDISTMLLQLQRESQNMCGKRGLLSDSDQQTYIILPPINLRIYCENLLIPFQKTCNLSQAHFKKEATSTEGNAEKTSIAYNSVNRFFCAFIDHAIRDMDYIIKEKTFMEKLLSSEFDNYLTSNKGTFYIDTNNAFSQLCLYGNGMEILTMELLLLMALFMITTNLIASIVVVCLLNKLFERLYRTWIRQNVATKTLIDRRFLI